MNQAQADAEVFLEAARLNREDPLLDGSQLRFPNYGQIVMTGDMHGHDRNLNRIKKFADLKHSRARHVVLHELIHSEPFGALAEDMSHQAVLEAAKWKVEYPDQVHFLQSNHELSQLTGKEITKNGRMVNYDFERGMAITYGNRTDEVLSALCEYIDSFPLAARTENRIFLSHSLPNARVLPSFDPGVVKRKLTHDDKHEGGHAYHLVWGRQHTADSLRTLADAFDVDWFICGHQPQETGWDVVHERMIILASDHSHGMFLPFDLRKEYTIDSLAALIRPLAAIT